MTMESCLWFGVLHTTPTMKVWQQILTDTPHKCCLKLAYDTSIKNVVFLS